MKNLLIAFLTIFSIQVFAQPSLQWDSMFNGPGANDKGNAIALNAGGNVYVTGPSDGVGTGSDFLTIKYDPSGSVLWSQRYNNSGNVADIANVIKVDGSGNVYVAGGSQGVGIVTIKYNSNGVQQWASVFPGGVTEAYDLVVDVSGNVYVVGLANPYGVVFKLNSLGVFQWSKGVPGDPNNKIFIAISNYDGNLILASGYDLHAEYYIEALYPTNGNVFRTYNTQQYPQHGIPNVLVLDGNGDIYVTSSTTSQTSSVPRTVTTTKYDYPGQDYENWDWWFSTFVTGNGQTISGVATKIDANLNLYVVSDFDSGANHKYHVKKYRPSDQMIWTATYNAIANIDDTPVSLSLNKSINPEIFVTGYTGNGNITTVKFDNNVNQLWDVVYDCGNNGIDIASAMVMDNCDNVFITGHSNCNGTNQDVRTLKYSAIAPTITPNGPTTFCQGGSVDLNASAGNSYLWSNGATSTSITVSTSGSYSVTVTNAAGCQSVSDEIVVTVVPPPSAAVTPSGQVSICQGTSTTLSASPASTYLWNTGATTQNISVSMAGNYWVTVTNAAGCSAVSAITAVLVQPAPTAIITPGGSISLCQGNSTTLMAGAASSYLWNTGATSQNITVSSTGNYWVTVTNAAGCTAVSPATTVTVNPIPTPIITPGGLVTICQGNSVMLSSSAASSYLWNTGATTPSITVSSPGSYSVTVTDAAGCVGSSSTTTVNVESPPIATITPIGSTTFCQGGSVILTASQASTYQWNTGATTQNIPVSATGDYSVTITNAAGCTASASIGVNATPVATITLEPNDTTCGNTDGFIITNVTGGSPIASFLWSNGATTQIIFNLAGGTYSLTATDVNGCTVTAQATVVGRVNPTVDLGPDITINSGQQATLIPNATGSGLSYLWSTNATTPTITVTVGGTYSVTVTNSDGCTATDAVVVNVITSTEDPSSKLRITVFPNPANDVVYITCEGGATLSARVLNILGEQLLIDTTPIPDGEVRTLWLGDISSGILFVEVIGEDFREMTPFVKQ